MIKLHLKQHYTLTFCSILFLVLILTPLDSDAGGFFEIGQVSLPTTIDDNPTTGWVEITMTQSYVNPIVVVGALTNNNSQSLSPRVRNVTATTFEIGMQSPCESLGAAGGVTCPPGGGWVAETAIYLVMEEGTWVFPDGFEVQADTIDTNTVRSSSGVGGTDAAGETITLNHTFSGNAVILHTVNTDNDSDWITTSVFETGANTQPPAGTDFDIALEGAEATNTHGNETIAFIAMPSGTGTNTGFSYEVGRSSGLDMDRTDDACNSVGSFSSYTSVPDVILNQQSMNGANGSFARLCGTGIESDEVFAQADEDQVNDSERTGNTEYAAWLAYDAGGFGVLDFITATLEVTDDDGGMLLVGDTLTYEIVLTNQQDDFAQADNGTPEFIVPIPTGTTYSSVVSQSSGTLSYNAGLDQMEWNGAIPASGTVTLEYSVTVDAGSSCSTIESQGTVFMDANENGTNDIEELSDDPLVDDGVDDDSDILTDDDDITEITVDCDVDLELIKTDSVDPVVDGNLLVYTLTVTNNGPGDGENVTVTDVLSPGVNFLFANPSQGSACVGTSTVSCNLGTLANGDTATVTIGITPNGTGTLVNTAGVTSDQTDPDTTNNLNITEQTTVTDASTTTTSSSSSSSSGDDDSSVTIIQQVVGDGGSCVVCAGGGRSDNEYITKSVDLTVAGVSQTLTYTVNFTNPRNINLRQVVIQDTLDTRLNNIQIVSFIPANAIANISNNTVTLQGFELAPAQSGTLTIQGTIDPSTQPGQRITNQAVLFSPDASSHASDMVVTYIDPVNLGDQRTDVVVSYVEPVTLFGPDAEVETFVLPNVLPMTGQSPLSPLRPIVLGVIVVLGLGILVRWRLT